MHPRARDQLGDFKDLGANFRCNRYSRNLVQCARRPLKGNPDSTFDLGHVEARAGFQIALESGCLLFVGEGNVGGYELRAHFEYALSLGRPRPNLVYSRSPRFGSKQLR
jgi:hypothetical protein